MQWYSCARYKAPGPLVIILKRWRYYMKYKLFVGQSQLTRCQYSTQSQANKIHRRLWVPVSCGFVIKHSDNVGKKKILYDKILHIFNTILYRKNLDLYRKNIYFVLFRVALWWHHWKHCPWSNAEWTWQGCHIMTVTERVQHPTSPVGCKQLLEFKNEASFFKGPSTCTEEHDSWIFFIVCF